MRIPDELLQCICFFGAKCREQGRDVFQLGGTAFFVSVPSESLEDIHYIYLVTARHCVAKAKEFGHPCVRMNTARGSFQLVALPDRWHFPDNEASDVAVRPWAPNDELYAYKHVPRELFATDEVIAANGIGVGDDLFVIGLFAQRSGRERNAPIVRSGLIAAMPDEPLQDEKSGLDYHAYLAEVRSIGGLSGSPVFAVLGPARAYNGNIELSHRILLLGLIRGHWDFKRRPPPVDFLGDELDSVNMGIAIVTPIPDVLTVIDGDELVQQRRKTDREIAAGRAPDPRAKSGQESPAITGSG